LHMIITALSKKPVASVKLVLREKKDLLKIGTVKRKPLEAESKIFECYYMEPTGLLEVVDVHKEVQLVNFILERKMEDDMNFRVIEAHEVEDLPTV
jgi:hypothetical protein